MAQGRCVLFPLPWFRMSSDVLCWQDVSPQKKLILSRRLVTPRRWNSSRSKGSSSSLILSSSQTTSGSSQINKRPSRKVLPVLIPQDTHHLHPDARSPGLDDSDLGSSISKTVSDSPHTRVSSRLQSHPPCVSSPAIFVIDQPQSPELLVTSGDIRRWSDNFTNTSSSLFCQNCSQNFEHRSSSLDLKKKSKINPLLQSHAKYLVRSSSHDTPKTRRITTPSGLPHFVSMPLMFICFCFSQIFLVDASLMALCWPVAC